MKKMKISIIIPVYNVEKYLRQCVDSILDQDYEEKEIILVDDGSPDNSGKICDEYAEKHGNVVVIHKPNGGPSEARNLGVSRATGDYILFVDSDDFIAKNSLSCIVETVNENPVDLVFLETQKYYSDGTVVPLGDGISRGMVYKKSPNEVLGFLSKCPKYPASPCTKLIRRSLINDNILFEKFFAFEDIDWSVKLFLAAKSFDYCGVEYYNYRQNIVGSVSNAVNLNKIKDMIFILEKWSQIATEKEPVEKSFILSQMAYELPILIYLYGKLSSEERKTVKSRIENLLFLLEYRSERKYKGTKLLCKICGVDLTSKFINVYQKTRG